MKEEHQCRIFPFSAWRFAQQWHPRSFRPDQYWQVFFFLSCFDSYSIVISWLIMRAETITNRLWRYEQKLLLPCPSVAEAFWHQFYFRPADLAKGHTILLLIQQSSADHCSAFDATKRRTRMDHRKVAFLRYILHYLCLVLLWLLLRTCVWCVCHSASGVIGHPFIQVLCKAAAYSIMIEASKEAKWKGIGFHNKTLLLPANERPMLLFVCSKASILAYRLLHNAKNRERRSGSKTNCF